MNDLKFALRQLFKRPAGTVIILVTLSLVIGSMSLVLGVIQHESNVMMPFPEPDRVVRLWQQTKNGPRDYILGAVYTEAAERIQGLKAVGAMGNYGSQVMTGEGEPKTLTIQYATASVFSVIEIPPMLGRTFSEAEVKSGMENLLVISHALWQSDFGGETNVIGREITLNEKPVTIIGVMPPGIGDDGLFYGQEGWLPKDFSSSREANKFFKIVGRRNAGVSASQLNAELTTVLPPLLQAFDVETGRETEDTSFSALRADKHPGRRMDPTQWAVIAMPVFILGIAAFNIANILLGRMLSRRHEFALRFTLGARKGRLIRQLLAESVLLALLGTVTGVTAAYWGSKWAATQGLQVQFSPLVLGSTLVFAMVTGVVVGWIPAWRATRGDLVTDIKETGGIGSGGGVARHRLRNFLAIGQVAMAAALCLGAGLLVRSYVSKRGFEPGFDPSNMVSISASLTKEMYPENADRGLFARQARERLMAVPGVTAVSYSSDRVVSRYPFSMGFRFDGQDTWHQEQRIMVTVASPNHLELVNVPVLRGRPLQDTDRRGSSPVLLVNQTFANRYFPDENPIGKRIRLLLEGSEKWPTIVGVVADRRNLGNTDDLGPEGYLSALQIFPEWSSPVFLVQTAVAPSALRDALRGAVQSVDSNVPVGSPFPVTAEIDRAVKNNLYGTRAIGVVAAFGLFMAMIGIYGVISYSVTERTYEMGVRMAMGASRRDLTKLVIGQGLRFAVIGLGVGLILGGMMAVGLRKALFGISHLDLTTYACVCLLLLATALFASWLPARRAARVDPMEALRNE